MRRVLALVFALAFGLQAAPAAAQVRLAAPRDCLTNPGCGVGLESVYGLDVKSALVPLAVADAGIAALDSGQAEVAVAFSSDPAVSRPDIVSLRDDRSMIYPDRVVPVVRSELLEDYSRRDAGELRSRLNDASAALSTLALRSLNQGLIDGRIPEAVGGEFVDANGLGGSAPRRNGPRIVVGYQDFAENEMLAYMYAEALRAGGFRVTVRSVRGLRREAVSQLRRDRIDVYPAYDGSLLRYLAGTSSARLKAGLRRTLTRIDAVPMRLSRAQNRNVFVAKSETAARLGIAKLSDLVRYWPRG